MSRKITSVKKDKLVALYNNNKTVLRIFLIIFK